MRKTLAGVVLEINQERGFGFIAGDDKVRYFFHANGAADFLGLRQADRVTFHPVETDKGWRALRVKREEEE